MTDRRHFLKTSAALALGHCLPAAAWAGASARQPKSLRLYHTHTGEALERVFWTDGRYVPAALAEISRLLRDHRTNEVAPIAPGLLSLLERIASLLGGGVVLHVISGYRSPHTNQMLVEQSDGVAKRSLHMEGRAIDIRIPGRELADLRNAALSLRSGGVGFYPRSQFVHVDTGRVRSW